MACVCSETRISYTDKNGNGRTAPVTYRCAEHRDARRADDRGRANAVAQFFKAAFRSQKALPAPPLLLAYFHKHEDSANRCLDDNDACCFEPLGDYAGVIR